ncbi:chemokine-like factor isoform X4 [Papio anubis]|uniref:Chemokine-like factor isoform b n=6 Tax=Cercopithecinae TaxID=9528 RepID=F7HRL6_MACMU|nr:chemokine-like factor [Macaca mulatta]XP_005592207.1 chemokine-like factor isoform X3 [Macaca fascicularis]XP_009194858.1 chemokine-like factor isoform X4 [Papio anubis]XP_011756260.1 chemokine-like factor isoform X4 [Macaca nemestrina]XP_011843281.1 PREDICTED: chemokine-like factor isoform X4 [Mandrillus leucophaeus]XP_025225856.1 chemokine-like factor isoform X4 [Theropithecus gelada]
MANVQPKIKHRPFCFSVKGHVKMLRLDIINSMVTTVFMLIVSVLALIPETTPLTVGGGVFALVTAVCCLADGALIYRKLLFNPSGPYQKKPVHERKVVL